MGRVLLDGAEATLPHSSSDHNSSVLYGVCIFQFVIARRGFIGWKVNWLMQITTNIAGEGATVLLSM